MYKLNQNVIKFALYQFLNGEIQFKVLKVKCLSVVVDANGYLFITGTGKREKIKLVHGWFEFIINEKGQGII